MTLCSSHDPYFIYQIYHIRIYLQSIGIDYFESMSEKRGDLNQGEGNTLKRSER